MTNDERAKKLFVDNRILTVSLPQESCAFYSRFGCDVCAERAALYTCECLFQDDRNRSGLSEPIEMDLCGDCIHMVAYGE